jgi:hypothetical protein
MGNSVRAIRVLQNRNRTRTHNYRNRTQIDRKNRFGLFGSYRTRITQSGANTPDAGVGREGEAGAVAVRRTPELELERSRAHAGAECRKQ